VNLGVGGSYTLSAVDGTLVVGVSNPFTIFDTDVWTGQVEWHSHKKQP